MLDLWYLRFSEDAKQDAYVSSVYQDRGEDLKPTIGKMGDVGKRAGDNLLNCGLLLFVILALGGLTGNAENHRRDLTSGIRTDIESKYGLKVYDIDMKANDRGFRIIKAKPPHSECEYKTSVMLNSKDQWVAVDNYWKPDALEQTTTTEREDGTINTVMCPESPLTQK